MGFGKTPSPCFVKITTFSRFLFFDNVPMLREWLAHSEQNTCFFQFSCDFGVRAGANNYGPIAHLTNWANQQQCLHRPTLFFHTLITWQRIQILPPMPWKVCECAKKFQQPLVVMPLWWVAGWDKRDNHHLMDNLPTIPWWSRLWTDPNKASFSLDC